MIPYGRQHITQNDVDSVVKVLQSDFLTQGPMVPRFEEAVSVFVNAKYAVAMNSATSALHAACVAIELSAEDWLWTSPNTFVASANCGLYCGAKIDFVDIDLDTNNISIDALTKKLEQAYVLGCLPKVLVAVHFAGQSCKMREIYALSKKYGFKVIEDASHAIGGKYLGNYIGECKYSDITVFSFHPVKIITTGEGGMAVTNNEELAHRMRLLRGHGITRDKKYMKKENPEYWYYEQISLGYNYRMTDISAALGLSQLKRVDEYVLKRNELAQKYKLLLKASNGISSQVIDADCYSSYHLFVVQLHSEKKNIRNNVLNFLISKGIGAGVHYIPVHLQPYYVNLGFKKGSFVNAEKYYEKAITLPLYPDLSIEQLSYISTSLCEVLEN